MKLREYAIIIVACMMLLGGGWLGAQAPIPCVERAQRLQQYGTIVAMSRHQMEVRLAALLVEVERLQARVATLKAKEDARGTNSGQ